MLFSKNARLRLEDMAVWVYMITFTCIFAILSIVLKVEGLKDHAGTSTRLPLLRNVTEAVISSKDVTSKCDVICEVKSLIPQSPYKVQYHCHLFRFGFSRLTLAWKPPSGNITRES